METRLELPSGFLFDYTNMMQTDGVSEEDLSSFAHRLAAAHDAVGRMRKTGVVRGHLSKDGTPESVLFPTLPYVEPGNINTPVTLGRLASFGTQVHETIDVVVVLGIGGSYLGNKVLFDVQCGEFWNMKTREERGGWPEIYFSGNNIDARRTRDLVTHLKHRAAMTESHHHRPLHVLLLVISKSGGTLDTMSNFMVIYDALKNEDRVDLQVAAVTDPNEMKPTMLHRMAKKNGWPIFRVPDGVGGRFSVFSDVGLTLAACIGFDIPAFLTGARAMDKACQTADIMKNPAMLNAALKYIAAIKYGKTIEVFMPYGDYLKSLAEWYVQLLAESLGKERDRAGRVVHYGRTPIVAVGTTDMHAQTQQHQEGRLDKVVQFVSVANWPEDIAIPNVFPEEQALVDIAGVTMAEGLEAACEANIGALTGNGRMNALFRLPRLNAFHLGELMYLLALSVAYEGELGDVDAFDQPGVEAYKRIMTARLKEIRQEKQEASD